VRKFKVMEEQIPQFRVARVFLDKMSVHSSSLSVSMP